MTTKRKIHIARTVIHRFNSGNSALSFQSFCGESVLTQINPTFRYRGRNLEKTLQSMRLDRESEVNCKVCIKAHTAYLAMINLNRKPRTEAQKETRTPEENLKTVSSYINPTLAICNL